MARTSKKQKELTPEEKLAQALVPVEDQPYPVPENWCWTTIDTINKVDSSTVDPRKNPDDYYELYSVPSCENDYPEIIQGSAIKSSKQVVARDDVLICKINPRINRVWKVSQYTDNLPLASSEWIVVRNQLLNPDYLKWYFKTPVFRKYMLSKVSGVGGSLMRAQPKYVKTYPVPIPPLAEQQRIVDRIECIFSKLDEAKEKAQSVIDNYEDRKSAILHQAFSGELTKTWRDYKELSFDSWKQMTVKDVCQEVKVGIVIKPAKYYTSKEMGTAAFRSANVREFYVNDNEWVYLDEKGMNDNRRSIVHSGDILIVRSGNPGTACVVQEQYDGFNAIDVIIAVPDKDWITSDYLCAFTNSPMGRKLVSENKRGMALAHFNVGSYSKLSLCVPSIEEQNEITLLLSDLLECEKKAKEKAEQVLKNVEEMKKFILILVFRGHLGTSDSNDEPVEALLERIL